jgi:hypothetical protein
VSIFENQSLACPACGAPLVFPVAHSLLADRRPDLRAAVLDGSFQAERCEECGASFRREPELNYVDIRRGQWMLVKPAEDVADWTSLEAQALGIYELAYGSLAPAPAQEIGRGMRVRIAFGWPAFREKLLVADTGLDDVALECLKLNLLRTLDAPAMGDTVELRLNSVDGDTGALRLDWIDADGERLLETLIVPREAYDQVAGSPELYAQLRAALGEGPFVDMNRLLIDPADREELPQELGA